VETVFFVSFVCLVLTVLLVQLLHFWRAWGLTAGQSTAQRVVPLLHLVGVSYSVGAI
jgi:hypothetical protein